MGVVSSKKGETPSNKLKYTNESFAEKARTIHGDLYDYSKSVYTGTQKYLTITCKIHGDFEQQPNSHFVGKGCPKCGFDYTSSLHRGTKESFLASLSKEQLEKYDYSLVDYKNNSTPVKIICPIHGLFEQAPSAHSVGKGCRECGIIKQGQTKAFTKERWIAALSKEQQAKFDFSLAEYLNNHTDVKIICPEHGVFEIRPANFQQRGECPQCADKKWTGYKRCYNGTFYVLAHDKYLKIGITNKTVDHRIQNIIKTSGIPFECIFKITFEDGTIPCKLETKLLRELRKKYKQPSEVFDGSTEVFLDTNVDEILASVNKAILNFNSF